MLQNDIKIRLLPVCDFTFLVIEVDGVIEWKQEQIKNQ